MSDTFDHFGRKLGSSVWPSDDPNDSSLDEFICKHCGESKEIQMCGSSWKDEFSFTEKARIILRDHLDLCPIFAKYQQEILDK
uniref:Uncharacterized protein n=2 Tax=viral metagenome TaxID=1070528 RepID=A0A6M3KCL8_9ZZZZ